MMNMNLILNKHWMIHQKNKRIHIPPSILIVNSKNASSLMNLKTLSVIILKISRSDQVKMIRIMKSFQIR